MNLETFKARARRKLRMRRDAADFEDSELELRDESEAAAGSTPETNNRAIAEPDTQARNQAPPKPPKKSPGKPAGDTLADRLATTGTSDRIEPKAQDPILERSRPTHEKPSASAPLEQPQPRTEDTNNQDTDLNQLRSWLLGETIDDHRREMVRANRRTHNSISELRQELDRKIDDLVAYVEQLQESVVNQSTGRQSDFVSRTEKLVRTQQSRLAATEAQLADRVDALDIQFEERQRQETTRLEAAIADTNETVTQSIQQVSLGLQQTIGGMRDSLTEQLAEVQAVIQAEKDSPNTALEQRFDNLSTKLSAELQILRDRTLTTSAEIRAELKNQTDENRLLLAQHRQQLLVQLSASLAKLDNDKVSHKQLGTLLLRLADQIQAR